VPTRPRHLGLFDVVCIGINGIIGTGIFTLPGRLAGHLGAAAWVAFAIVGVLLVAVALCFAEVSSMFRRNGGPYLYARAAFGAPAGFCVGWICWVTMILGWSAVASGMLGYVAQFSPALADGASGGGLIVGLIAVLATINILGIKPGAWTTNVFTIAKLLPLLLFVAVGAVHVRAENLDPLWPSSTQGLGPAIFIALFTLGGFENTPVPAGETARPERHMPVAMIGALLGAAALYVAVQIVAAGTLPGLAGSDKPLADAAATFLGPTGAALMAAGALVSMTGFTAGSALLTPRYLQALADDGLLPAMLGRLHRRFATPHIAIGLSAGLVMVCTQTLDFDRLVDLSVVAVLVQYLATCVAIPVLRRKQPLEPRTWRLRGGPIIPGVGVLVALLFVAQSRVADWLFAGAALAVGVLIALASRAVGRH